MQVAYNYR